MTKIIEPSVSRHVWFYPDSEDAGLMVRRSGQPLHAVIIFVLNERTVNLSITDHDGFFHTRFGVALVQPGDELPGGSYAAWMPYQVGQAKSDSPNQSPITEIKPVPHVPFQGGEQPISPVLADLIATTPTSLKPEDLAGIQVGADMTPADGDKA